MITFLLLCIFLFRFSICKNNTSHILDYCSHPDCSLKNQHTMCLAKNKQSTRLFASGMTPWMRYQILLLHNRHRDNIAMGLEAGQPRTSNMRKMYWDDELEEIAEVWARQCQKRHDECRNTIRFNVLQNMDVRPVVPRVTEAQLLADAVGSWFSGSRALPSDHIWSFRLSNCSAPGGCNAHWYSAATWASTWRIGCSQAICTLKKPTCINFRKRRTLQATQSDISYTNRTRTTAKENILRRTKYFTTAKTMRFEDFGTTSGDARQSILHRGIIDKVDTRKKLEERNFFVYTFCNYGPAGNIEGFPIYEVGPTCSNCPDGTKCIDRTHSGLCSVIGDPDSKT